MLTSAYFIISIFLVLFANHVLHNITDFLNELLTIDINGWIYWILFLILLSIIEPN